MCRLTHSELELCVDGIMNELNYHHCRLHHYNMEDVIYCLTNNRHIAFIGDSRIRQQFLNFVKVSRSKISYKKKLFNEEIWPFHFFN